jgi:m7GpppX diphosphatase
MSSLYTMALVLRRDITSVRDLRKKDVPWLRRLQEKILGGICDKYSGIEADQIRLYIHCEIFCIDYQYRSVLTLKF